MKLSQTTPSFGEHYLNPEFTAASRPRTTEKNVTTLPSSYDFQNVLQVPTDPEQPWHVSADIVPKRRSVGICPASPQFRKETLLSRTPATAL